MTTAPSHRASPGSQRNSVRALDTLTIGGGGGATAWTGRAATGEPETMGRASRAVRCGNRIIARSEGIAAIGGVADPNASLWRPGQGSEPVFAE
ncbi:hypothetical protein P0F65_18720 [Sphingomonas sp. I4]